MNFESFKEKFSFLTQKYNMHIIKEEFYPNNFGNILLEYKGNQLTMRVLRDKAQVLVEILLDKKWFDFSFFIAICDNNFDNEIDINKNYMPYIEEKDINLILKEINLNIEKIFKLFKTNHDKEKTSKKMKSFIELRKKNLFKFCNDYNP